MLELADMIRGDRGHWRGRDGVFSTGDSEISSSEATRGRITIHLQLIYSLYSGSLAPS